MRGVGGEPLAAHLTRLDLSAPMNPEAPVPATPAEATAPAPAPIHTDLGLLLMVGIWGINFSVIKVALAELSPLAFNALRFPFASLLVYAVLRRRGPIPLPAAADRRAVLAMGLVGNVIYQLFFVQGMDRTRAGNASLLLAGAPIVTALLSAALGHERLAARTWAGVAATVLGIGFVVRGGAADPSFGMRTLVGDLLMVGASLAWAAYTVGARGLIARHGPLAVTAWTLWIGTAALFLLGAPDLLRLDWGAVSARAWASVMYAGMLGIGLAYLLWYRGVRYIGNTRTATYGNLVPIVAILVAWAWLGEVPTAWQAVGAAVIIGGVTLVRRP